MADLLDPAHPGTEDVVDVSLRIFKRSNRLGTDHAAVCDDTEPANAEPIPNPLDDGNQRDDIRRIARPHLTAHGLAMVINDSANDHLVQIGTTVLTVALLSEGLTPSALKGDGGRIEEDKIKSGEQITTFEKQCFFNKVLGTPRRKGCGISLVCYHLTQEGHGSIEMMQAQPIHTFYDVVTVPFVTSPVRARDKESMKDGKENRPLDIEAKLPFRRKTTDHVLDPELFPQPPEDERRPDRSRTCCHLTPARQDQQHLLRVAGERADERLDLSLRLEPVHAAKYLWYADMLAFRSLGRSMTGATYAALPYGPQLNNYRDLVDAIKESNESAAEPLSRAEIGVLDHLVGKFPREQMIYDAAHRETVWSETPTGAVIPYSRAFELTEV